MNIEIRPVSGKKERREFIHLPARVHANHAHWIPPIYMDEWKFFNPKSNKSFSYCDTVIALAWKENKAVGRIMGIINHQYNKLHNEQYGRFCFLECWNDPEVAVALLDFAENWAREKGMQKIIGPLAFSDKDPQGLLVDGFEVPMVIVTAGNYEYLVKLVESNGYTQFVDLVEYRLDIPEEIPEFYHKISARTLTNGSFTLHNFSTKAQLKPWIRPVFVLLNQAYANIYGFVPLNDKEIEEFVSRYLDILDVRFVKVVSDENKQVIAFIVAMPDISEGIIKAKGKLFPFGVFKILSSAKKTKKLVTMLGAVKDEYRNRGLDTLMGIKILDDARKAGMTMIDSHLILETNIKMRGEYERMGGFVHKRYRIYQKTL